MINTICFFNTAIPWGGGEKWHFEMAKSLHDSGHSVWIICHKKSVLLKKAIEHGIPHKTIRNSNISFLNPLKLFYVKRLLKKHNVTTLILNLSQDVKLGGMAGQMASVRRIIYRRGSAIPVRNSTLNRFLYSNIIDEVLVNSKSTKDCILQHNSTLFPEEYITVIPNGIDCDAFNKKAFTPYFKRTSTALVLTNLGRLEEQKNQLFLIDVARELVNRGIEFQLIIGGSGRLEDSIRTKIKALDVEDYVRLVGFVDNPKDLYMSGDLFLLPSHWEGFGYVIAEAGVCEKPTIAFNVSSNPEIIKHNETGVLIPANNLHAFCDAIVAFDKKRSSIAEVGEKAKQHILNTYNKATINKKLHAFLLHPVQKKITAIVTTYNEEKNIEKCLESIKWVDEILVIDSFSTDKTVAICKQYGATVLQRKYVCASDQKNWAIPQAKHPWIVLLDADEVAESTLTDEVAEILHTRPKHTAYWLKRKNYFLGKYVRFCGWQNDHVVRFFHRDYHRYENKMVHEEIASTQKFGVLETKINHYTTYDLDVYTKKIERYAQYAAQEFIQKKKKVNGYHLYVKPTFKFFHSYIIRGGIFDGKTGWIICKLRARETFLKAYLVKKEFHDF